LIKHALIFTNSYPNPEQPERGVYTAQIVGELQKFVHVTVVNPLPWFPDWSVLMRYPDWYLYARIPDKWEWEGIPVHRVRYPVIPGGLGFSQAAACFFFALPKVREIHRRERIDVINAHYLYPEGVAATAIGRLLRIPVVLSARGSDVNYLSKMRGRKGQIRWAVRSCSMTTAVSRALSDGLMQLGVVDSRVRTIPNGVNQIKFPMRSRKEARALLRLQDPLRVLLFVGLLKEVKGLHYLIESLSKIRDSGKLDFATYLVGDGPLRVSIEEEIRNAKLEDSVSILGMKAHEEVSLWMAASDLIVLPSLNEGMPNVVLEALACGRPVVATHVGGVPDLVSEGNGLLVPPADSAALAGAIVQGFKMSWNSETIRKSIQGMTWEETARQHIELYEEAIKAYKS
jgi:glycosyltransferase involved in cell wall biosynthesis